MVPHSIEQHGVPFINIRLEFCNRGYYVVPDLPHETRWGVELSGGCDDVAIGDNVVDFGKILVGDLLGAAKILAFSIILQSDPLVEGFEINGDRLSEQVALDF